MLQNIDLFPPDEEEEDDQEEIGTKPQNIVLEWLQTDELVDEARAQSEMTAEDWKDLGVETKIKKATQKLMKFERTETRRREFLPIDAETGEHKKIAEMPENLIVIDVYLAFMNAHRAQSSDEYKRRINRMVSYVTGSYTHVETIFLIENMKTGKKKRVVSSVYMVMEPRNGEPSRFRMVKKHQYHRPERWCFLKYKTTPEIKQLMFRYDYSTQGTRFNQLGMFWNFLIPFDALRVDRHGSYVFCSEQIVRCLQYCEPGEYKNLKPYATGPLELFEYICQLNRFERVEEPDV